MTKLSSAEKQKAYRERKAKQELFGNDYCVTQCLKEAELAGDKQGFVDLFNFAYNEANKAGGDGAELVRRVATLCYSFLSVRNAVYGVYGDKTGQPG